MRSLLFLFFILVLLAACNSKTASVSSGSVSQTAPYLWEGPSFPKDVKISTAFADASEIEKINEMATAWDTSVNNQLHFFSFGGTNDERAEKTNTITGPNQLRDNILGIYKAINWPYPEYPDALAITQIFAIRYNTGSSNEYVAIREADIIMNYENFVFYLTVQDPAILDYDFRTVLLHEMGHFLGLQHKSRDYNRNNTVMYPSIFSYEEKRAPKTIDQQDIAAKYSITLPLRAGGSAIVSDPVSYSRSPSDKGEMVKVILELKSNGDCIHRIDGAETGRHHIRGLKN